jgi:hypothetical protein
MIISIIETVFDPMGVTILLFVIFNAKEAIQRTSAHHQERLLDSGSRES